MSPKTYWVDAADRWRDGIEHRDAGALAEVGARGVSYYIWDAEVHPSAHKPRKHGVTDGDAVHAAGRFLVTYPLPTRVRRFPTGAEVPGLLP